MEYQFYLDQAQKQLDSSQSAGLASVPMSGVESINPGAQGKVGLGHDEGRTQVKDESPNEQGSITGNSDACHHIEYYIQSLLTHGRTIHQCGSDRDALSHLKLRAKDASTICELTNAKDRLHARVGSFSMPLARKASSSWLFDYFLVFYFIVLIYLFVQLWPK